MPNLIHVTLDHGMASEIDARRKQCDYGAGRGIRQEEQK